MDIHLFSPLGEIYAHLVLKLKPLTKKNVPIHPLFNGFKLYISHVCAGTKKIYK